MSLFVHYRCSENSQSLACNDQNMTTVMTTAQLFLHLTEDEAIKNILQGNTLDEIHFSCIDELTEGIPNPYY